MEDCRLQFKTDDGMDVSVFDTCCKDLREDERIRRDTVLIRTYNDILIRAELRRTQNEAKKQGSAAE